MEPTLGVLSIGTSLLGAGIGAQGAMASANAQSQAARYQAQVAANNAITEQQNARYAISSGQSRAEQQDFQTGALVGQQEAAQGASGIDLTTGSPKAVRAGTQQMGRLGSLNINQNAQLQAYGYNTQATSFGAQSILDRYQAGYAKAAGGLSATTTLLGGASSVGDKFLSYQLRGVF